MYSNSNNNHKRRRAPAGKPAVSRPDQFDFSLTQEEYSADVFWGDSPPVDDFGDSDIFDGRYGGGASPGGGDRPGGKRDLPTIDEDEDEAWTAPVPKRNKNKQGESQVKISNSDRSKKSFEAIQALLSPTNTLNDSVNHDSDSFGEGYFDTSFTSDKSFTDDIEAKNQNSSQRDPPPTLNPSPLPPSTSDATGLKVCDQSYSDFDFEMLDKLVAESTQKNPSVHVSAHAANVVDNDSQPELTDPPILPFGDVYGLNNQNQTLRQSLTGNITALRSEPNTSTRTRKCVSDQPQPPRRDDPESFTTQHTHRRHHEPPHPRNEPPQIESASKQCQYRPLLSHTQSATGSVGCAISNSSNGDQLKLSTDRFALKRQQALEKRRLAKQKAAALASGMSYPITQKSTCASVNNPPLQFSQPPASAPKPAINPKNSTVQVGKVTQDSQVKGIVSAATEDFDDFAALEALMSKYDNTNSTKTTKPVTQTTSFCGMSQASSNGSEGVQGAEMTEFDAIEAMMSSVESQFCRPKVSNSRTRSLNGNSLHSPKNNRSSTGPSCGSENFVHSKRVVESNPNLSDSDLKRNHNIQRASSYPGNRQTDNIESASKDPIHNNRSTTKSISEFQRQAPTRRHCHRLIAVDVNTKLNNEGRLVKQVRCLDYYHSSTSQPFHRGNDEIRRSLDSVTVFLYDDWCDSDIRGGNILHVILSLDAGAFSSKNIPLPNANSSSIESNRSEFHIDNSHGLVVIHPDILVTPTKIADSFACSRKAVLSDRIRGGSLNNQAAVLGSLKHQFIEQLIKLTLAQKEKVSPESNANVFFQHQSRGITDAVNKYGVKLSVIEQLVKTAVSDQVSALYSAGISDDEAISTLRSVADVACDWAMQRCNTGQQQQGSISDHIEWMGLESWEEMVWCPILGIKGQVDLILRAKKVEECGIAAGKEFFLPVELKTGKWRPNGLIGHRAQAMLYVMMLSMRSKTNLDSMLTQSYSHLPIEGVLLYLGNEDTKFETVSPQWAEVRALVLSRNKLAVNLNRMGEVASNSTDKYTSQLPSLLKNPSCKWCFSAAECMLYHRAVADKTIISDDERPSSVQIAAELSGVPDLYKYLTEDISDNQMTYFKHWDKLLDLESKAADQALHSRSNQHGVWTYPSLKEVVFTVLSTEAKESRLVCDIDKKLQQVSGDFKYIWCMGRKLEYGEVSCCDMDFVVGDRLSLSLLKRINSVSTDIEDVAGKIAGWDVANVEPHVASGVVLDICDDSICIAFPKLSNRIKSIAKMVEKASLRGDANTSHWDFRLDKEEFTMSLISVLRSNVLRLITVPHEPNMFIAAQSSSKSGQVSGDTTKPMLRQSIVQLSSLVIDLLAPRFKTNFNHLYNSLETLIDTDIQLFLPPLNPIQLHFIQKLKSQSNASGPGKTKQSYPGSLTTATRQFYECSPPPLYVGCHPLSLLREFKLLNSGQQDVVKKVIASMDYTLLLGMPGTGKTSTLSFVIRTLVSRGDRVLITSYTNAAVDNLMNKLRESGVSTAVMGRLGHVGSLDSSMEEYAVDATNRLTSTVKDLTDRVEGYRVIGATVLTSARSGMLQKLAPFDWCVMDEAGQISQPAALGGMLLASKHLLVGDNYQLPPLVVSLEAQQQGMEVSMFKRLGEAHPNAVVSLTSQYRMNADIMSVSNCLIYENRLRCGSQVVAESRLRFRFKSQVIETLPVTQTLWLHHCLSPNNAVVFVNTDTMRNSPTTKVERYDGREVEYLGPSKSEDSEGNAATQSLKENKGKRSGGGALKKSALHNPTEIAVISLLVEAFACCGLENIDSAIGIVSPYRSQVRSIQKSLQCLGTGLPGSGIDATTIDTLVKHSVSTVDKYQGRDMDVIVLSLVRSNDRGMVGDLLRDWRRVNVALTRAKCKLIIIGSLEILERVPVLHELKRFLKDRKWVVDLSPGALDRTEQIKDV